MAQAAFTIRKLFFRQMCNYTKDLVVKDFLYNNLKNARSTKNVLDEVSAHSGIMNNRHIMQALRSLFTLQKLGNSDLSTRDILHHRDFRKLCRQLKNQASSIELNETIEALKIVSYVGVPSDSTIVQVLLQLVRHNVNFLTLQQIIFLDFLLTQFKPSPLVDALKIALPLVFQINLDQKIDYENPSHLADYLFYASRNRLSDQSVALIVKALEQYSDFDPKSAKSIIWSICDMKINHIFGPLIKKAINSLVVHLEELDFNDMETTLSKLISHYSKKSTYCYDETFYDSCANYVIDKDLGYRHALYVLRKFARVNYFNFFLLDYMSRKIHEQPELILEGDPVDIYSIVVATGLTDYRPVYWDDLKKLIARCDNIAKIDRKEIIWIKFAASLCLVDVYKVDVLTKCLNESFLENLFKKRYMSDFDYYCTVWKCIKLFKPELNCLLSERFAPEILVKSLKPPLDFPLESSLHKVLGGEKYVITDISSKFGDRIDHVVVFRKGGYPVALNNSPDLEFIEDIEVQPDNQLVAILGLRYYNYTLNCRRLRCSTGLSIKVLENQGFTVVPVCLEIWENLPDFEKIPYLMRTIKEKSENDVNLSESVL